MTAHSLSRRWRAWRRLDGGAADADPVAFERHRLHEALGREARDLRAAAPAPDTAAILAALPRRTTAPGPRPLLLRLAPLAAALVALALVAPDIERAEPAAAPPPALSIALDGAPVTPVNPLLQEMRRLRARAAHLASALESGLPRRPRSFGADADGS